MDELQRFRRDLVEMDGPPVRVSQRLDEMGRTYPQIESLILQVARTANPPEMRRLMVVAKRFGRTSGTARVADELLFQLLARRLATATQDVVETMAFLKGGEAKEALRQCVRAEIPTVRHCGVAALIARIDENDLPFALTLSREQTLDLQLRGVELLRAIGNEEAVARLVELLSKNPALAAAACSALVQVGQPAVAALQQRAGEGAVDRSSAYAAFALAEIAHDGDPKVLPEELFEVLRARLQAPEVLTRCLVAVALADLSYRSTAGAGNSPDREIVDALLLVVEPEAFVPNLDMLRLPAEQRLLRITGRTLAGGERLSWREWWAGQREWFLGVRADVAIDEANVGQVVVTLRQSKKSVRLLGEAMADQAPRDDMIEVVLTREQMLALVREMRAGGYGNPAAMADTSGLPEARALQLQVPGGRTSASVSELAHPVFDALAAMVTRRVDDELWQLYRIAVDEPDRAAFWRSERRWLDANQDPVERGRRFVRRVLRGWARWDELLRARALAFVAAHPQRQQLMGETEGAAAVAQLQEVEALGTYDRQLLELAAAVEGDRIWPQCVALAVRRGDRETIRGVFRVLGADAVLASLDSEDLEVRRAAIDEVVATRDMRASPRLVALLTGDDELLQRAAAYACGQLRVGESVRAMVGLIADEHTSPLLRRECLRAIGRVGGDMAFAVLQRAVTAPAQEDKEAALRGLGELEDPRAAYLLADFVVAGYGKQFGDLASFHLLQQGAVRAVPALRAQVQIVRDADLRADLVLMLGRFQDAKSVPDLIDLLRGPKASEAARLLEGATGVDLSRENGDDRLVAIEQWWRQNRDFEQWQWLLSGLQAAGIRTTLLPEHFGVDMAMGAVPELARLLVEAPESRFWPLCSAVLRRASGADFGIVTQDMPPELRAGIADRYRQLAEQSRSAKKD